MGIYIKKVLGYGLQMTADEASGILNRDVIPGLRGMPATEYKEFLEKKHSPDKDEQAYYLSDLSTFGLLKQDKYTASDSITIVTNSEIGGEGTGEDTDTVRVVITPPLTCKEWKHNDDAIDYYEEAYKYQNSMNPLETTMKFFNHGLFPYEGNFTNHRSGERFDSRLVTTVQRYLQTRSEAIPEEDQALRLLLASVKVSSVEEFHSLVHPAPPQSVLDVVEWTGIFKDVSTAQKLRPALLKYWS